MPTSLWTVIAALVVIWLIATVLKFTIGGLINILLLIAIGLVIWHFVKGAAAKRSR